MNGMPNISPEGFYAMGLTMDEASHAFRRDYLLAALAANGWNQSRTSAAIGVHRNTLDRHLRELGIDVVALKRAHRRAALRGVSVGGGAEAVVPLVVAAVDATALRAPSMAEGIQPHDVTRSDHRTAHRAAVGQAADDVGQTWAGASESHAVMVNRGCKRGSLSIHERLRVVRYLEAHRFPGAQKHVAEQLGVSPSTISHTWRKYQTERAA